MHELWSAMSQVGVVAATIYISRGRKVGRLIIFTSVVRGYSVPVREYMRCEMLKCVKVFFYYKGYILKVY
jgi:hypothetical protein